MKPTSGSVRPKTIDGEGPEMQKYMEQKEKEVTKQIRWRRKTKFRKKQSNTHVPGRQYTLREPIQSKQTYTEHQEFFGANIAYRPNDVIRIGYKNIHGFPSADNDVKFDYLQAESTQHTILW